MKDYLRASIEIDQEHEFEFEIGVEYSLAKEWDDFRRWEGLELHDSWVEGLENEECDIILNGKITCFYSESLEEHDTDLDFLFGDEEEFRNQVKKWRENE